MEYLRQQSLYQYHLLIYPLEDLLQNHLQHKSPSPRVHLMIPQYQE